MGAFRPLAAMAFCLALAPAALAQEANDNLNAVLWMQKSVEYKANAEAVFALAKIRLDQALKDKSWTAAPAEQTGDFKDLTPAIVADADETVLDNSGYQAWMVANGETFNPKTWTKFVNSQTSTAVPGAVEFAKYAESKGVRVFYVTNRTKGEEPATRENMRKLGFPMTRQPGHHPDRQGAAGLGLCQGHAACRDRQALPHPAAARRQFRRLHRRL